MGKEKKNPKRHLVWHVMGNSNREERQAREMLYLLNMDDSNKEEENNT